ncbi:DUF882 domain-containing protein [Microvirga sp. 17 mud 1-3]|uniref:DUF882 domain-containing protein n=1 Tax=Microvirga sp. 17 mud 1-3 TaxID=2082949 RepID=UPI001FE02A5F|nr:DUF882 domain-containing protein [Microvirga sp. 17 mud 1-3]
MRVLRSDRRAAGSSLVRRTGVGLAALLAVLFGGTRGTQDAVANGDTRTLTFYHNNTKESLTVTFRRNGQYDPQALEQLNWFLRDWRREEKTRMDPRLFDTVWEVYREVGSSAPVHVNSAYRSPQTNSMLRRRSSVVAKNSQHMQGKALDFYLPDAPADRLRAIGMRLQRGGVGYYPNAYTPFVHLDVGSVRAWPRMTRDQLVRLFPDGKTVHIPADGTPLPGYELARAEILANGGAVAGYTAVADAGEAAAPTRRKSLWATLFGGSDEDEDVEEIRAASRPGRALMASRSAPPQQNYYASDSNSSVYAALQTAEQRTQVAARPAPVVQPRPAPMPEPEPMPAPSPAAIAAAAPALREEITPPPPLPPTRIAGPPSTVASPSGPTLAWQQGPTGIGSSEAGLTREIAFAPMPPRRPDDIVSTGAIAYAPIPPARPSALAQTNPIPGLADLRATAQLAELPSSAVPLPPPRPGGHPVTVASIAPVAIPVPATREAIVPEAPKAPAAAKKAPSAKARAKEHPATARALLTAGPSLQMGFSSKPVGDLATNRFTGPAVKPLPVVR